MPFFFTTLTLIGAKAAEATSVESSSNQVKELADRMQRSYKSLAEGYVPSPQQIEQAKRWYEERGLPFDSLPDDAQGTSREETSKPAEKLSSSRESRGIPLKKKVKVKLPDSRSRKIAPGEEIVPFTMEIHQGEQDKDKGKEPLKLEDVNMASVQARKEEVKASQEALERVVKLVAERRQLKEQESSVPRRKLDEYTPFPDYTATSIVFVHGFKGPASNGDNGGFDCYKDYWGDTLNFLSLYGLKDLRTIGYYTGDTNCDASLLNSLYSQSCANYHADAGSEGTNNESIYHLSCKFAQYMYNNFQSSYVTLVGHGMGGIIIREAMYRMQENAGKDGFPSTIGYVTDVITLNTPHGGLDYTIPANSLQACGGCTQTSELMTGSSLMTELNQHGRDPVPFTPGEPTGLQTHWTVIGSECDQVTEGPGGPKKGYASAIDMDADFTVVYERNDTNTCYDYSGALHDTNTKDDAWIYYCSANLYPCGANYTLDTTGYISFKWVNAGYGRHSLSQLYRLVSDAPMVPSSPVNPPAPDNPLSIVFIHGIKIGPEMPGPIPYLPWKGSSSGWDCIKDYWGDAINFLRERGLTDLRTIKYYTGDTNCANGLETRYSSDLHNETYTKNCTNYPAGYDVSADGTNDESLYHLSCLFSQYLYQNFGQSNRDVIIVAHSMGGMITCGALHQMDQHAGQYPFPDTIGQVTKAITFNSPHGGVYGINALGCAGCQQAQDLVFNSAFMSDLSSPAGLDPQPTKGLTTVWSVVGSECDNIVGGLLNPNQYANAIDLNANFALVYASGSDTCYDHGGALHDSDTKLDAKYYHCNTSETGGSPCGLDYNDKNLAWKETAKGLRGLQLMYYLISGLDIEQAGEGSSKKKALEIGLTVGGVTAVAVGGLIIAKMMKGGNGSGGHGDGPQASTSGTAHIELAQQPEAQEVVADEHGEGHGDFDAAAQKLREDAARLQENWEGRTFRSAKKFAEHCRDHLAEWSPPLTEEQYLAKARELLSAPPDANIEGFVSETGKFIYKYNNATNELAIGMANGVISTFYKPKPGRTYWLEEIEKNGGPHVFGGK